MPGMKAAVRDRYGSPEVVRIEEVRTPSPGPREVLVRVHATTVNRTDCGFRAAHPWIVRFFSGLTKPKFRILGTEFAGVVELVGSAATSFRVGDRVFGFSEDGWGAHAEFLTIPEDGPVTTMPDGFTFEEVAPSTEGSHYADNIIRAAAIRRGDDVLVNGATGAIGSAAVQLLRHLGANVTAVCAGQHGDLVRSLGAERIIDHTREDFTRDAHTFRAVLDAVGKSSFGRCRRLLKPGGTYVSTDLGPWSQNPLLGLVTPIGGGKEVRFPIPRKHNQPGMQRMKGMLESGTFRPVIDRTYSLDHIMEAYRYVESGQKIGNVVISVAAA
jgi:NADPH:quinone reductase-like Zn-dependent oxidoreductase